MSDCSFTDTARSEYPRQWCTWPVRRDDACSVYTIQPRIGLQCHCIRSRILRLRVCLAATCHLHFWQDDLGLVLPTAVTRKREKRQTARTTQRAAREPLQPVQKSSDGVVSIVW